MLTRLFTLCCLFFSITAYSAEKTIVNLETNMGAIVLELYPEKAPITVKNFITYVNEGYYSGTIFHRVIKNFMIQGGGFTKNYARKKNHPSIANEAFNGLTNDRGTIAMARTGQPHSATSQFFINTRNNSSLNFTSQSPRGWGYTVFGKVISGMETVDKIENSKTGPGGMFPTDVPQTQVIINKVSLL